MPGQKESVPHPYFGHLLRNNDIWVPLSMPQNKFDHPTSNLFLYVHFFKSTCRKLKKINIHTEIRRGCHQNAQRGRKERWFTSPPPLPPKQGKIQPMEKLNSKFFQISSDGRHHSLGLDTRHSFWPLHKMDGRLANKFWLTCPSPWPLPFLVHYTPPTRM